MLTMAPLVLEGNTLGERQRHYNQLLKEFLATNHGKRPDKLCHDDPDLENFLKIDTACHNRDVNYIIEVLKCKDLLYITRAIKRSKWLITDDKHANVINPKFLHTELFPYMMTKAKTKFVLEIRLRLKDETRVKSFYKYYKETDLSFALTWLPRCPQRYAQSEVSQHADSVPASLLKLLCRKDISFLNIIKPVDGYARDDRVGATMFLIKKHTREYLDILDLIHNSYFNKFSKKALKTIMKVCPNRILENFSHYINKIDYPTFFKHMKRRSIKPFLLKCSQNEDLRRHFTHEHFMNFLPRLEAEDRLKVIKLFYNDYTSNINWEDDNGLNLFFSAMQQNHSFNTSEVYRWYQCMPFDVSFREIKKLIRMELKSEERHSMLSTLVICAQQNLQDIHTVLQYYHDNHINEAYVFKIGFINHFLECVETYRFDKEMWILLDNLFGSMEVYINSSLDVQKCIETVIVYKIVNDERIPEIIAKKLEFNTFKAYQRRLSEEEGNKLFGYLYNLMITNLENETVTENDICEKVKTLEHTLILLADWNKNVVDYSIALNKVKEFAKINQVNLNLSSLYNVHNPWKKYLFEVSFELFAGEEVILNALKHDSNMIFRNRSQIEMMLRDENMFFKKVLGKLRTYWSQSLAKDWEYVYLSRLEANGPHQTVIKSLALLLPQKDFLAIVEKNIPNEMKINWKDTTELEYSLRKSIAMNIHMARPLPDPAVVLSFSKGDYLQYALPSLNTTLLSISDKDREEYVPKLLMLPESLQKHGVCMAFEKMNVENFMQFFEILSKQNSSIQILVFENIRQLLCREKKKTKTIKLWKFLNHFIEIMSPCENDLVCKSLARIDDIPLVVRAEYCVKGYLYFKSLPPKLAHEYAALMLKQHSMEMVEILDGKFIEEAVLTSVDGFSTMPQELIHLLVDYILSADNRQLESDRYDRYVKPLLVNPDHYNSSNFEYFTKHICNHDRAFSKNKQVPVILFDGILNHYERQLVMPRDYVALTAWKLKNAFIKILEKHKSSMDVSSDYLTAVMPQFGTACLEQLHKDFAAYFPSIYLLFQHSLNNAFSSFDISKLHQLVTYKYILADQAFLQSYFLVHKMLPSYCFRHDEKAMNSEVISILCSQPSKEFRMLCYYHFSESIEGQPKASVRGWSNACVLM